MLQHIFQTFKEHTMHSILLVSILGIINPRSFSHSFFYMLHASHLPNQAHLHQCRFRILQECSGFNCAQIHSFPNRFFDFPMIIWPSNPMEHHLVDPRIGSRDSADFPGLKKKVSKWEALSKDFNKSCLFVFLFLLDFTNGKVSIHREPKLPHWAPGSPEDPSHLKTPSSPRHAPSYLHPHPVRLKAVLR